MIETSVCSMNAAFVEANTPLHPTHHLSQSHPLLQKPQGKKPEGADITNYFDANRKDASAAPRVTTAQVRPIPRKTRNDLEQLSPNLLTF